MKLETDENPYAALTDSEIANKLFQMESILEQDTESEGLENICWIRNHLIEEIIFRYTGKEA